MVNKYSLKLNSNKTENEQEDLINLIINKLDNRNCDIFNLELDPKKNIKFSSLSYTELNNNLGINLNSNYKKENLDYDNYFNLKKRISNIYKTKFEDYKNLNLLFKNNFFKIFIELYNNDDKYEFILGTNIFLNNNNSVEFNIDNENNFWSGYKYETFDGYLQIFNDGKVEDKLYGYGFEIELNNNHIDLPNKSQSLYYYKNYNDKSNDLKLELNFDNFNIGTILKINEKCDSIIDTYCGIKYNLILLVLSRKNSNRRTIYYKLISLSSSHSQK